MGLFKGGKTADEKAREFATKKDIRVDGAVAVGRGYDDSAEWVMAVHPDRVEVHHLGKVDSLMKKGAKATVLPRGRIGSVSASRDGIFGVVTVHGSGENVEFRTDLETRDRMAEAVQGILSEPSPAAVAPTTPPTPAAPPPPTVPAGWYPQGDLQRYWDGTAWTEHTAPLG